MVKAKTNSESKSHYDVMVEAKTSNQSKSHYGVLVEAKTSNQSKPLHSVIHNETDTFNHSCLGAPPGLHNMSKSIHSTPLVSFIKHLL